MRATLKHLLNEQYESLNYYFNALNLEEMEKILNILLQCQGTIFFSGVGKSGLIAKKIAFTMISTGTRASYLSPMGAMHGDMGIVTSKDLFIILSKSGESDELLQLIPAIRNKGATLIGIVCTPNSRLEHQCQYTLVLPFEKELCLFNMAPTTSSAIQLLFGDLLTVSMMQTKQFTLDEYALNHPSGRIGKRMTLKVKDLMLSGDHIPFCKPEDKLMDILVELSNKRCGCILIKDSQNHLLGIFTDGDLRRNLQQQGEKILTSQMQDLMTKDPLSIDAQMLAFDAMRIMEAHYLKRVMVLPVIDKDKKVLGLIHLHDIIQSGV